jgi:hypothetical protein
MPQLKPGYLAGEYHLVATRAQKAPTESLTDQK